MSAPICTHTHSNALCSLRCCASARSTRLIESKEPAFLVRIFHVFLWRCSKLELHFTRKAGWTVILFFTCPSVAAWTGRFCWISKSAKRNNDWRQPGHDNRRNFYWSNYNNTRHSRHNDSSSQYVLFYLFITSHISGRGNIFGPMCVCVHLCFCLSMPWALSLLNRLTYNLDFWHGGWPRPRLVRNWRSMS